MPVTGYTLYYAPKKAWSNTDAVEVDVTYTDYYMLEEILEDTDYCFSVRAENVYGYGEYSEEKCFSVNRSIPESFAQGTAGQEATGAQNTETDKACSQDIPSWGLQSHSNV